MVYGWDTGGTTLALTIILEGRLYSISLGDSLIFHWSANEGKPHQIFDNHSITGILLKRGVITPEEAKAHHLRNHLRYFLGMNGIPLMEEIENTTSGTLAGNEIIMLCSDGCCQNAVADAEHRSGNGEQSEEN